MIPSSGKGEGIESLVMIVPPPLDRTASVSRCTTDPKAAAIELLPLRDAAVSEALPSGLPLRQRALASLPDSLSWKGGTAGLSSLDLFDCLGRQEAAGVSIIDPWGKNDL